MLESISERNSIFQDKTFYNKMSTTRSQKRKNDQQEGDRNVSEGFVSPVGAENHRSPIQDVEVAGPSRSKSPRIEKSSLENLRASLKEEITSEIKTLLIESQKEMLKLLKPEIRENTRNNIDEEMENETRSFHTPTRSVRKNSTQNDPNTCRNSISRHYTVVHAWILVQRWLVLLILYGWYIKGNVEQFQRLHVYTFE